MTSSKLPSGDLQLLARIVSFVSAKMECSMGDVEDEFGLKEGRQYSVFAKYGDRFPGLQLKRRRWKFTYIGPVPVADLAQEVLSAKGV